MKARVAINRLRLRSNKEIALRVMIIVPLRVHRADNIYGAERSIDGKRNQEETQ